MKLLLLCVFAAIANAQSNNDCPYFRIQDGRFPPDHGDYGSCGGPPDIAYQSDCYYICDSTPLDSWTLVGNPYHCGNNRQTTGGPMKCVYNNYVPGKRNCTVSSWNSRAETECNTMCGGGTETWTRTVINYGEPGGEPCPRLSVTVPCNNFYCNENILSKGYYHWGPFCAGAQARNIGYTIRTNQNIDLYVFDEPNFKRYTWDSALSTPQNTYYQPVTSHLTTYFEVDSFIVPPGKCYYLVLDHTGVGPTKGNDQGEYTNVNFDFAIRGATPADGFSDFGYQKGLYQPASAVRSASISFFGAFLTTIIVLMLKLQ